MTKEPKQKIWCLFSVEINYDQPENNLVWWRSEKPTIEELAQSLGYTLATSPDDIVIRVVEMWLGHLTQIKLGNTAYRLQEVSEGESP